MKKTGTIGILSVTIASMMMFVVLSGCRENGKVPPEPKPPSEELKAILPQTTGFKWVYSGFAEYGHTMELKSVNPSETNVVYEIEGEIYDASGGEAGGDYSLKLEYDVTDNALIMKKQSERMMDGFSELELLRLPLQKGTSWEQKATHKDGTEYNLTCSITEVEGEDGNSVYTVVYDDKNSDFYEKRKFHQNRGVVSFETLWKSGDDSFEIGYRIYDEASGSQNETFLNSFLPPMQKMIRYFGLAEYAHEGSMVKLSSGPGRAVYQFNGEFRDGSGIPGEFKVRYDFDYEKGTVTETVVENTRSEKNEINSRMHDPVILKLPLEAGNSWQQEITFNGEKKTMTAQVVSIAYEGRTFYTQIRSGPPVYTLRYTVSDVPGYFQNMYVEERRFQQGFGMTGFSMLMEGSLDVKDTNDTYQVEQAIIAHMFGYSIAKE